MAKIIRDSEDIIRELQPNNVDLKLKLSNDVKTDLNNKVGKTDYATDSVSGVIKTSDVYQTETSSGVLKSKTITYSTYQNADTNIFISKGTLENVLNARIGDIDSVLDAINGENI
jgi:hypothetical protein